MFFKDDERLPPLIPYSTSDRALTAASAAASATSTPAKADKKAAYKGITALS